MKYDARAALVDHALAVFHDPTSAPEDRDAARQALVNADDGAQPITAQERAALAALRMTPFERRQELRRMDEEEARKNPAWWRSMVANRVHDAWQELTAAEALLHELHAPEQPPVCYACMGRAQNRAIWAGTTTAAIEAVQQPVATEPPPEQPALPAPAPAIDVEPDPPPEPPTWGYTPGLTERLESERWLGGDER